MGLGLVACPRRCPPRRAGETPHDAVEGLARRDPRALPRAGGRGQPRVRPTPDTEASPDLEGSVVGRVLCIVLQYCCQSLSDIDRQSPHQTFTPYVQSSLGFAGLAGLLAGEASGSLFERRHEEPQSQSVHVISTTPLAARWTAPQWLLRLVVHTRTNPKCSSWLEEPFALGEPAKPAKPRKRQIVRTIGLTS